MDEASRKLVAHKVKTAEQLAAIIGPPPRAKTVIMCHGTFDIVHPGHVRHLLYAKSKADLLIASLTADAHITKADMRPYVPQELRAFNLAALESVDYVVIDPDAKPLKNLAVIKPDYFAKGYEYNKGGLNPATAEEKQIVESYGGEMIFTPGDIVYSSSQIITTEPPKIATEKLISLLEAEGLGFADLRKGLEASRGLRVHIVGDTIIDSYTHCAMIGGMTKTPTISVRFEEKHDFVGGAGIVAKHLKHAGAEVVFSTVLGDDAFAELTRNEMDAAGVDCEPIIDPTRPTTNKNVIVAGGYHLLKVDTVDNRSISERIQEKLKQRLSEVKADIVVFSDFRHGIFNRNTIPALTAAIPVGAFRVADSQVASRWGNILEFTGFDLLTPNEREARFALGDQDSVVRPLGLALYQRAECRTLILKLGERGLMTFRTVPEDVATYPRAFFSLDSFAERVIDAVGTGDALLAYACLSLFATQKPVIASVLGSMAAAVACEHEGNVPVKPEDVLAKLARFERLANFSS
jgi:rfaE bifunctional protein kinase chain/domain